MYGDLVVSGNKLYSPDENLLDFSKNKYEITVFAEQNKNKFTFPDGSEIITDSRGMLTFRSSNKSIEEFLSHPHLADSFPWLHIQNLGDRNIICRNILC